MANPEPTADFLTFFVIGDGEAVLPDVLKLLRKAKKEGWCRKDKLAALGEVQGVYVPSLFDTFTNSLGEVLTTATLPENKKQRVKRRWVDNVSNEFYLTKQVIPNIKPIQTRLGVEVMRGCTRVVDFVKLAIGIALLEKWSLLRLCLPSIMGCKLQV